MSRKSVDVSKTNIVSINIPVSEVLTQRTCGNIVIEIIKTILYQKLQTPCTYAHLKFLVEKKLEKDRKIIGHTENWHSQKYFSVVSSAIEILDDVFKNIMFELESEDPPEEVRVILGATPIIAKVVYRIPVPRALRDHWHVNHSVDAQKLVMKVMRNFVTTQDLHGVLRPLTPTNVFILLKRKNASCDADHLSSAFSKFFLPMDTLRMHPKTPQVMITIDYQPNLHKNCCRNLSIFDENSLLIESRTSASVKGDSEIGDLLKECSLAETSDEEDEGWFRAPVAVKGFKDCFVNGQSVSRSWMCID